MTFTGPGMFATGPGPRFFKDYNDPKPVQKRSKNGPLPQGCGIAKRALFIGVRGMKPPLHGSRNARVRRIAICNSVLYDDMCPAN